MKLPSIHAKQCPSQSAFKPAPVSRYLQDQLQRIDAYRTKKQDMTLPEMIMEVDKLTFDLQAAVALAGSLQVENMEKNPLFGVGDMVILMVILSGHAMPRNGVPCVSAVLGSSNSRCFCHSWWPL